MEVRPAHVAFPLNEALTSLPPLLLLGLTERAAREPQRQPLTNGRSLINEYSPIMIKTV